MIKITFEMTKEAALNASFKAGCKNNEEAELTAIWIQRRSSFKIKAKDSNKYRILNDYQNNGYRITDIEVV